MKLPRETLMAYSQFYLESALEKITEALRIGTASVSEDESLRFLKDYCERHLKMLDEEYERLSQKKEAEARDD